MYNNFIVWARTGREGSQHAYFPQRGVITAWRDVFSKLSAPNIMEFDLKSFFDSVNLAKIQSLLINRYGFPRTEAHWITALNRSIPKLTNEDKIEEPDRAVAYTHRGLANPEADPSKLLPVVKIDLDRDPIPT